MHAYIWAQGDDVWDLVLEGYVAPTKTERTIEKRKIETKDGVEEKDVGVSEFQIPKPKIEWTTEEKAMSVYNQKGIHAIFDVVSSEQFAHIRNCQTSMEAWDNLMIVHEGNNKVKKSKLQRLTSQFEKLEMPYVEFYEKIIGIVNSCASLGKVKLEVDVVEKILRSLPVRLHPKKTAIEEARDIDTFSLADLSGALQTYESELCPIKKANLVLKVIKEEDDDCNEIDPKQLALITRHFQKLLKKQNSKGSGSSTRSPINKTSKDGSQRFIPKSEGRKCYACSGYGHEDKECANTISKQKEEKKAMKASYNSWSDSESNMFEVEEEEIAFVALENNDEYDDSYEEDVVIEETRERYKELYLNFDKVKKQNDGLKIKVSKKKDEWQRTETSLRSQVNNLLAERDLLKEKLKEAEKKLHRLII
ncbi:PREDICTED: zf-CCHC domain-containing [Prunus dulcis]|uniref:PREDICTED: zf-CCHC domain-containing n=1 Tax=Prunus dulcis TaxID=3755 RepID=A0A5E4GCQ6_PRUDU|nr:uncharacterized protein LOC117625605 [Prunus dulcis]VVA37574.1 PREDICTED: zf-CCHC domain-containing [Prunus dulcis]